MTTLAANLERSGRPGNRVPDPGRKAIVEHIRYFALGLREFQETLRAEQTQVDSQSNACPHCHYPVLSLDREGSCPFCQKSLS